jgi:hypothetical protein
VGVGTHRNCTSEICFVFSLLVCTRLELALSILAVPWLRWLAVGLLPQRPGFMPRSVHVGFVVDRVALRQVSLLSFSVFPVSMIPLWQ